MADGGNKYRILALTPGRGMVRRGMDALSSPALQQRTIISRNAHNWGPVVG